MKNTIENKAILISDSHYGIYIPQMAVERGINNPVWDFSKCSKEDINIVLEGPENEFYFDAWINILDNITIDYDGEKYFLVENEDLWAIPESCLNQIENWLI